MSRHTIYVTGHKNPDTDSIISAMAYAYFKQQMGFDAIAVRIGEINKETEYILNLFNEFPPPLIRDIRTCVRDIDFDDVATCKTTDNLATALSTMMKMDKKVIAVVDDRKHLMGMATVSDIAFPMLPHQDSNNKLIRETPIEDIAEFIDAKIVYKAEVQHTDGHVFIASGTSDRFEPHKVVISSDNEEVIKLAICAKAATIISSHGEYFSEEILQLAKKNDCNLLTCDRNIYDISKNIYFASPITKVMSTNLTTFKFDDFIEDVMVTVGKSRYRCYPIIDSRKHVIGTLSRYHVVTHTNRNLILVDHNELSQSIEGAEKANILEVIDHHRIGGIKTASPVFFRNEQLGCCASIITKIFRENNVPIPEDLAGLLCCAIISDTVNFKSVTCTQQDIDIANYLAKLGNINISELAPKILMAGASLADKSCKQILNADLKRFDINKVKVVVSQCNIVSLESIMELKNQMEEEIEHYAISYDCGIVLMAFTLIDGTGSYILMKGKMADKIEDTISKYGKYEHGFFFLPGFISRKLQIIPMISEGLS